jgi:AraC-like DNA-binding protein
MVEFVYILAGQGVYEIGNQTYPVSAGDLVIYNSNVLHYEFNNDPQLPILCCAATDIQLPGFQPNHIVPDNMTPVFPLGANAHTFRSLMQMMFDVSSEISSEMSDICQSLFLALLRLTLRVIEKNAPQTDSASSRTRSSGNLSEQICAYVNEHIYEELSVPAIAKLFGISESYFSRIFKQSTGYSLTAYQQHRKIGKAQTLLLMTNLTIAEIASEVGYRHQSYFTKLFTSIIGVSPTRYRKLYQGSIQPPIIP